MQANQTIRFRWRIASDVVDVEACQRLRHLAFRDGEGLDRDPFDEYYQHVLIEDANTGELAGCFRLLVLENGRSIDRCYSAQHYDLSALTGFPEKLAEVGRFCTAPKANDPDIVRVAWSALTRMVDEEGIALLFGCSSFHGTEIEIYADAFAMLKEKHLAPKRWLPKVKAPDVFRFARRLKGRGDRRKALLAMPPLLRSYLSMGGWVSDHAVVDRDLNTLHVFTGLEIRAIPPTRARALRAVAG